MLQEPRVAQFLETSGGLPNLLRFMRSLWREGYSPGTSNWALAVGRHPTLTTPLHELRQAMPSLITTQRAKYVLAEWAKCSCRESQTTNDAYSFDGFGLRASITRVAYQPAFL